MGYLRRANQIASWPLRPSASIALRYGLALVSLAVALGLAQTFLHFHLPQPFTAFALSAIAITFWYGGIGAGIVPAVLGSNLPPFFFEADAHAGCRHLSGPFFFLLSLALIQSTCLRKQLVARRTDP